MDTSNCSNATQEIIEDDVDLDAPFHMEMKEKMEPLVTREPPYVPPSDVQLQPYEAPYFKNRQGVLPIRKTHLLTIFPKDRQKLVAVKTALQALVIADDSGPIKFPLKWSLFSELSQQEPCILIYTLDADSHSETVDDHEITLTTIKALSTCGLVTGNFSLSRVIMSRAQWGDTP